MYPTLFALLGLTDPAFAQQECSDDEDCPTGFECGVVGGGDCAEPDCAPGSDCPDEPACDDEEIFACVPSACESDAECGENMRCFEYEAADCPDQPACPPGEPCDEPDPPDCTTTTTASCAPNWALPCERDADCGAGFECVERESCQCSGSGGGVDPVTLDGGKAEFPMDEMGELDCSCEPSGEFYCRVLATECERDGDCPEDWICEPDEASACGGGTVDLDPASLDAGQAGAVDDDCGDETDALVCTPSELYRYIGDYHLGDDQANGETGGDEPVGGEDGGDDFEGDTDVDPVETADDAISCECEFVHQGAGRSFPATFVIGALVGLTVLRRRAGNGRRRT
jgi:hypothetical protein